MLGGKAIRIQLIGILGLKDGRLRCPRVINIGALGVLAERMVDVVVESDPGYSTILHHLSMCKRSGLGYFSAPRRSGSLNLLGARR